MIYSERLREMEEDRLQMVEVDTMNAIEFHRRKGNLDTVDTCKGILNEIRQEIKRRAEGGPPT